MDTPNFHYWKETFSRPIMGVLVYIVDYDDGCIYPVQLVVPGQPDAEVEVGGIGRMIVSTGLEIQQRHIGFPDLIPFVDKSIVYIDFFHHFIGKLVEGVQAIPAMGFTQARENQDDKKSTKYPVKVSALGFHDNYNFIQIRRQAIEPASPKGAQDGWTGSRSSPHQMTMTTVSHFHGKEAGLPASAARTFTASTKASSSASLV